MNDHRRELSFKSLASSNLHFFASAIAAAMVVLLSTGGFALGQATTSQTDKAAAAKDPAKKDSADSKATDKAAAPAKSKAVDPFADDQPDVKSPAADKSTDKSGNKSDTKPADKSDSKLSPPNPGLKDKPDSKADKNVDDPFATTPPAKKDDRKSPATDPFGALTTPDSKTSPKTTKHSDNPFEEKEPGKPNDGKAAPDAKSPPDNPLPDMKPLPDGKTPDAKTPDTGPRSPADLLKDTRSTEPEPTPGQAELKKGQELLDAGKYADAIAPLKEAIKKAPTDAGPGSTADAAHYTLGVAYRMLNRYDDAIEEFSEAIKLNSELGDAYFRRGICWYYKDEYPLAQADFEDASATTTKDSDRTRPLTWKGMALVRQGLVRDAVNVYSEALRYDNAYAAAHINRGLAYLSLKEYPKAIADFDQAIRSTPKDASLYFKRGAAQSGAGDWAAAVKSYSEAIRLNPSYADAYANRSLAYRRIGDTAKSQSDAERSQQLKADADRAKQSASSR